MPAGGSANQHDEVYPPPVDLLGQEISRFMTAGLLQFRRINKAETNASFDPDAAMWDRNASQETVAVEHLDDGHPECLAIGCFWRIDQGCSSRSCSILAI